MADIMVWPKPGIFAVNFMTALVSCSSK